jgi:probable FeS assembly SUF system protein SufT
METNEAIKLTRDCEAILVPSGEKVALTAGSRVRMVQSLGGSYTVTTDRGAIVCIPGKDADALGIEPAAETAASGPARPGDVEKLVWDQLRMCFDPEIPINIVDLGLVYGCRVASLPEGGGRVDVEFTLTARGCGMGETLKEDIKSKLASVPGVKDVDVRLVWDPPWDQSRMSPAAKLKLGMV